MDFTSLGLADYLARAVEDLHYGTPTWIQEKAIPQILEGHDLLGEAKTGTGKTASFALPIIQRLNEMPKKYKKYSVMAVVLTPTRELALQVAEAFEAYARYSPKRLWVTPLIGGAGIRGQITKLRHGTDIVVATPGRLLEIFGLKEIRLREMQYLVVDEADKMLEMGFASQVDELLRIFPKKKQNLLFSATFPPKVTSLSEKILRDPVMIRSESASATVESVNQRVIEVDRENRGPLLRHLIKTENWNHILVFVSSKQKARNIAEKLKKADISAGAFHSGLSQEERCFILRQFENRNCQVLVATDLATRGIDFDKLEHVINFDLPRSPTEYIHRVGRTGRMRETGMAITFVGHEDQGNFKAIEKRANIRLDREQIEGFELSELSPDASKGKKPVKGKRKSKKDILREKARKSEKKD